VPAGRRAALKLRAALRAALGLAAAGAAAACASATPPTPPTPAALQVLVTDLTEPLAFDLAAGYAAARPFVAVVPLLAPAAGQGDALAAGQAELGLAIEGSAQAGVFTTPIGYVRLVVVVNPANSVSALTPEQARAAFTGQARDWSQLGAAPAPLEAVVREPESDGARLFGEQVLAGPAPSALARLAPTWDEMRRLVAADPGRVGYLPAYAVDESVRVVAGVEARALVVAVAPGEPAGPARDFLAWAQSPDGQAVVTQRYEAFKP
jgi:ABC-type phosphate transport system substrate-binding protein